MFEKFKNKRFIRKWNSISQNGTKEEMKALFLQIPIEEFKTHSSKYELELIRKLDYDVAGEFFFDIISNPMINVLDEMKKEILEKLQEQIIKKSNCSLFEKIVHLPGIECQSFIKEAINNHIEYISYCDEQTRQSEYRDRIKKIYYNDVEIIKIFSKETAEFRKKVLDISFQEQIVDYLSRLNLTEFSDDDKKHLASFVIDNKIIFGNIFSVPYCLRGLNVSKENIIKYLSENYSVFAIATMILSSQTSLEEFPLNVQEDIIEKYFGEGFKNHFIGGNMTPVLYSRKEFLSGVLKKELLSSVFEKIYGTELKDKYDKFIDNMLKKYFSDKEKYSIACYDTLLFLFREKDIIKKATPENVILFLNDDIELKILQNGTLLPPATVWLALNTNPPHKKKLFHIIQETYGEKAVEFLRTRPGLCNVENVPTFEFLKDSVMNNFRLGFIDDLYNYNFFNIDDFVKVTRSPEELELFKKHYKILAELFGENCETMDRAFKTYESFRELLIDIDSKPIPEEYYRDLIGLYCTTNFIGIKKVEELSALEEKILSYLRDKSKYLEKNVYWFNWVCENVFNINAASFESHAFDCIDAASLDHELSKTYKSFMAMIKGKPEFFAKIIDESNGEISLISIMYKMIEVQNQLLLREKEIIKSQVLTEEKIDQAILAGVEGVKRVTIRGVEVIFTGTMKDPVIGHTIGGNNGMNSTFSGEYNANYSFLDFEGIGGISTISTSYGNLTSDLIFLEPDKLDFVGVSSQDGNVPHTPKLVQSFISRDMIPPERIRETIDNINSDRPTTEIAFYRRARDHKRLEELQQDGGRVLPSAVNSLEWNYSSQFGIRVKMLVPINWSEKIEKNIAVKIVDSQLRKAKKATPKKQIVEILKSVFPEKTVLDFSFETKNNSSIQGIIDYSLVVNADEKYLLHIPISKTEYEEIFEAQKRLINEREMEINADKSAKSNPLPSDSKEVENYSR